MPEIPRIGLSIRTSKARQLESALHEILRLRGRWIGDAPGKEWFNTSPEEILSLATSIDPELSTAPETQARP
jgi:hypothetical protein